MRLRCSCRVRARGRIDVHDRADLRIHELLDQAGVEVAGIEGDEADRRWWRRVREGDAHGEEEEEGRSPKSEVRSPKEGRKPKAEGTGARGKAEERIR